jgi:hypothetical protein
MSIAMIWGRSAAVLVVYYLSKGNIPQNAPQRCGEGVANELCVLVVAADSLFSLPPPLSLSLSLALARYLSLSLYLSLSQMPNSKETVAVLMEQMDPDGSGTLDWEEFKILVKQVIGCLLQDVNGR